jgi:hypothetical protein
MGDWNWLFILQQVIVGVIWIFTLFAWRRCIREMLREWRRG